MKQLEKMQKAKVQEALMKQQDRAGGEQHVLIPEYKFDH